MTTLHMQTEAVRTTARQMAQNGEQTALALQSLSRAVQALQSSWKGGSSEEFGMQAQDIVRRLNTQADILLELAGRVDREVTEWEETDQRGASILQSNRMSGAWFGNAAMPMTAGGWTADLFPISIAPLMTSVSLAPFLTNLPAWLSRLLDRFFPPATIISPLPDVSSQSTGPGTTPLGELLKRWTPASSPEDPDGQLLHPDEPLQATPSAEPVNSLAKQYDLYYDIPAKSQGELFGQAACLPTSMSMALDHYHAEDSNLQTATPQQLVDMLDPGDGTQTGDHPGIGLDKLNDDLAEIGYLTEVQPGNMDDLEARLQEGPVIVNAGVSLITSPARDIQQAGNYNHAMLVKGINTDSVVVNDPWSGVEKVFSRNTFEKMWTKGQNYMVIVRPEISQ